MINGNKRDEKEKGEQEVTPTEDLMREHGLLNRVLLIYEEIIKRLISDIPFDITLIMDGANIIRTFIEDYHEKSEEDYLFSRFRKANILVDLVITLKDQHEVGRTLTDHIKKLASSFKHNDAQTKKELIQYMSSFICMYRAHETREDTILFPELRKIISPQEFKELGEIFEQTEHQIFGKNGFENMIKKAEHMEKELNIYELSNYTSRLDPDKKQECLHHSCLCQKF